MTTPADDATQPEFPRWPSLADDDISSVVEVLTSSRLGQFSSRAVPEFEEALAAYVGTRHAVAVNSGTAAVHTALAALDVGPGDEVVVPAHTFIGSASPVVHQGATPVFADVNDRTYCLCPESLRAAIGPRTKAVVAVHLNGACAPMNEILSIAADHGLAVIEDVAQAIGGTHCGRRLGSLGDLAAFSFWEDKIVTTGGEGGAVVTDDSRLAERMRRFRHHGEHRPPGAGTYSCVEIGYNYRMTAMQAALGTSQMRRLPSFLADRKRNAAALSAGLGDVDGLQLPPRTRDSEHAYWKYVCRIPSADEDVTDRITAALQERGVPAFRRYPVPLHRQPAFVRSGFGDASCPVTDRLASELFSLPVHPLIGDRHVRYMTDEIAAVLPQYL